MGAAHRRKRLRKSLKLFHPRQGETARRSERLIRIARPYLNCGDDLDEYRKELTLASTARNLSLFPPDSREENVRSAVPTLVSAPGFHETFCRQGLVAKTKESSRVGR